MSVMPYVNAPETSTDMVTQFGGYNHNTSIADGEFYDMKNMTVNKYPLASTRENRKTLTFSDQNTIENCVGSESVFVSFSDTSSVTMNIDEDDDIAEASAPDATIIDGEYYTSVPVTMLVNMGVNKTLYDYTVDGESVGSYIEYSSGTYADGAYNGLTARLTGSHTYYATVVATVAPVSGTNGFIQFDKTLAELGNESSYSLVILQSNLDLLNTSSDTVHGDLKSPVVQEFYSVGTTTALIEGVSKHDDSNIYIKWPHAQIPSGSLYCSIGKICNHGDINDVSDSPTTIYVEANCLTDDYAKSLVGRKIYFGNKGQPNAGTPKSCVGASVVRDKVYLTTSESYYMTKAEAEKVLLANGCHTDISITTATTDTGNYQLWDFYQELTRQSYSPKAATYVTDSDGRNYTWNKSTSMKLTIPHSAVTSGTALFTDLSYLFTGASYTKTLGTADHALIAKYFGKDKVSSYSGKTVLFAKLNNKLSGEEVKNYINVDKYNWKSLVGYSIYHGANTTNNNALITDVAKIPLTLSSVNKPNYLMLVLDNASSYISDSNPNPNTSSEYLNANMIRNQKMFLKVATVSQAYSAVSYEQKIQAIMSSATRTVEKKGNFLELKLDSAYTTKGNTLYVYLGYISSAKSARTTSDLYSFANITTSGTLDIQKLVGTHTVGTTTFTIASIDSSSVAITKPHPLIAHNLSLTISEKNNLYLAEYDVATQTFKNKTAISKVLDNGARRYLVPMGAYIVAFPEKVKVNTLSVDDGQYTEIEKLEAETYLSSYSIVDSSGRNISIKYNQTATPTSASSGDYWLNQNSSPPKVMTYNEYSSTWNEVQCYCKTSYTSDTKLFDVGDAVQINWGYTNSDTEAVMFNLKDDDVVVIYSAPTSSTVGEQCITFPIATCDDSSGTLNATISRKIPDMDYIIECNNRLWGCKYGTNEDGDVINEIFASKLGDPSNWYYFQNTSMDSYYVSLGDDGNFTGAVAYESNPIFFRENCIHRIYGNYPSNYQLKTIHGPGVAKGSYNSAVVMNDIVYYLSQDGVMTFNGGMPVKASSALGSEAYSNGNAGVGGHDLYMTLYDSDNTPNIFVYNDNYGTWHKHDNLDVGWYVNYRGKCYGIATTTSGSTTTNSMVAMCGGVGTTESDFDWMLETGKIGFASPYKKYINKITLRFKLSLNARARILIQYDGDGNWHRVSELIPKRTITTYAVPIVPHRCDHFAIRIEGHGAFELLGATKFYTEGTDYD